MSDQAAQLKALASETTKQFCDDVGSMIEQRDAERLKELVTEITRLKAEKILASDEDEDLIQEIIDTKIGTMAHVLDSERIVISREAAVMVTMALKTCLSGFSIVAKELIKVSIRTAIGGAAGAILGPIGDSLAEKAMDAAGKISDTIVDKATDSGVAEAGDVLDDLAGRL